LPVTKVKKKRNYCPEGINMMYEIALSQQFIQ
jgi:hypothetical protein